MAKAFSDTKKVRAFSGYSNPKISVIIATHNNIDHLGECLDSVLCRQMKGIEVIVVDVLSADGTKDYIDECKKSDERIVFLADSIGSIGHARNKALKYAKGEYVVFVEPDDYIGDDMLEYLYLYLEDMPETGMMVCRTDSVGAASGGRTVEDLKERIIRANETDCRKIQMDSRIFRSFALDGTAMYRKSFIEENGLKFYDEPGYGKQDVLFRFWAMSKRSFLMSEEVLYYRRFERIKDKEADIKAISDVNNELRLLREILMKDSKVWWAMRLFYWQSYYDVNMALYEKLTDDLKPMLSQRIQAELKIAIRNKEFSREHFDAAFREEMELLLDSPDKFDAYQKEIARAKTEQIKRENYNQKRKNDILAKREKDKLESSIREKTSGGQDLRLNRRKLREEMTKDMAALRMLLGMSVEDMGNLLGISTANYKSLESGKKEISWDQYMALMFVFRYNTKTETVTDVLGLYPEALQILNRKGIRYV